MGKFVPLNNMPSFKMVDRYLVSLILQSMNEDHIVLCQRQQAAWSHYLPATYYRQTNIVPKPETSSQTRKCAFTRDLKRWAGWSPGIGRIVSSWLIWCRLCVDGHNVCCWTADSIIEGATEQRGDSKLLVDYVTDECERAREPSLSGRLIDKVTLSTDKCWFEQCQTLQPTSLVMCSWWKQCVIDKGAGEIVLSPNWLRYCTMARRLVKT